MIRKTGYDKLCSLTPEFPFIASPFMAAHSEAERMAFLAEKHGLALLWSGYRNNLSGQPCEVTHLSECLDAVERRFSIDRRKITLTGACGAGAFALQDALAFPNAFSAIALLDPMFGINRRVTRGERMAVGNSLSFNEWLRSSPAERFVQEPHPPLLAVYDGAEEGHGSLAETRRFANQARQAGHPVLIYETTQQCAQHFGAWAEIIAWLATQQPAKGGLSKARRTSPTAADVVADSFVIVPGSAAPQSERAAIMLAAADVIGLWSENSFGPCRIQTDVDYVALKSAPSPENLILVGNQRSNLVWAEIANAVPVAITGTEIRYKGHSWVGSDLTIEAVVNMPEKSDRLILLVGCSEFSRNSIGIADISRLGWFKVAAWRTKGHSVDLVYSE